MPDLKKENNTLRTASRDEFANIIEALQEDDAEKFMASAKGIDLVKGFAVYETAYNTDLYNLLMFASIAGATKCLHAVLNSKGVWDAEHIEASLTANNHCILYRAVHFTNKNPAQKKSVELIWSHYSDTKKKEAVTLDKYMFLKLAVEVKQTDIFKLFWSSCPDDKKEDALRFFLKLSSEKKQQKIFKAGLSIAVEIGYEGMAKFLWNECPDQYRHEVLKEVLGKSIQQNDSNSLALGLKISSGKVLKEVLEAGNYDIFRLATASRYLNIALIKPILEAYKKEAIRKTSTLDEKQALVRALKSDNQSAIKLLSDQCTQADIEHARAVANLEPASKEKTNEIKRFLELYDEGPDEFLSKFGHIKLLTLINGSTVNMLRMIIDAKNTTCLAAVLNSDCWTAKHKQEALFANKHEILRSAVEGGHEETVKVLLNGYSDAHRKKVLAASDCGLCFLAVQNGHLETTKVLLDACDDKQKPLEAHRYRILVEAVKNDHRVLVEYLFALCEHKQKAASYMTKNGGELSAALAQIFKESQEKAKEEVVVVAEVKVASTEAEIGGFEMIEESHEEQPPSVAQGVWGWVSAMFPPAAQSNLSEEDFEELALSNGDRVARYQAGGFVSTTLAEERELELKEQAQARFTDTVTSSKSAHRS